MFKKSFDKLLVVDRFTNDVYLASKDVLTHFVKVNNVVKLVRCTALAIVSLYSFDKNSQNFRILS